MLSHINNKYIDYSGCFIHYNTQSPTKWYIKYHYKDKNKMQKKEVLIFRKTEEATIIYISKRKGEYFKENEHCNCLLQGAILGKL